MSNLYEQVFPVELIEQEISELRKVGMFKSHLDETDKFVTELAIGRAIAKQDGWANSGQYWDTETGQINTLEILRLDHDKVWQEYDTEFIVQGNRAYESVIAEFGQISEGHFTPTEITEEWESGESIKVTFKTGEEEHVIYPKVVRDWADIDGILKYLNKEILTTKDYQFYNARAGDVFVIGLSSEEREKLSELIGVDFFYRLIEDKLAVPKVDFD